jgi:predicted phosphodiesterase
MSDLHREHDPFWDGLEGYMDETDLFIFAGDIDVGTRGIHWANDLGKQSIYVPGNHEYYNNVFQELQKEFSYLELTLPNVNILNNRWMEFNGIDFYGTTLWTDYNLFNPDDDPIIKERSKAEAAYCMADHAVIMMENGDRFSTDDAEQEHIKSRSWLEEELSKPKTKKRVVITHHGPTDTVVNPRFIGDRLNPAFYSNLEHLFETVDLWIYGHTHYDVDFMAGDCRVVSRQKGYPNERRATGQSLFQPLFLEI